MRKIHKQRADLTGKILDIPHGGTEAVDVVKAASNLGLITNDMVDRVGGVASLNSQSKIKSIHLPSNLNQIIPDTLIFNDEAIEGKSVVIKISNYDNERQYTVSSEASNGGSIERTKDVIIFSPNKLRSSETTPVNRRFTVNNKDYDISIVSPLVSAPVIISPPEGTPTGTRDLVQTRGMRFTSNFEKEEFTLVTLGDNQSKYNFGKKIKVSNDGTMMIVSYNNPDYTGGVDTYLKNDSGEWTLNDTIETVDSVSNNFGISLGLSLDKSMLVVGDSGDTNTNGFRAGKVLTYRRNGDNDSWVETDKLICEDNINKGFGSVISLSLDKTKLYVGNREPTKREKIYIFNRDTNDNYWVQSETLNLRISGSAFSVSLLNMSVSQDKDLIFINEISQNNNLRSLSISYFKRNIDGSYNNNNIGIVQSGYNQISPLSSHSVVNYDDLSKKLSMDLSKDGNLLVIMTLDGLVEDSTSRTGYLTTYDTSRLKEETNSIISLGSNMDLVTFKRIISDTLSVQNALFSNLYGRSISLECGDNDNNKLYIVDNDNRKGSIRLKYINLHESTDWVLVSGDTDVRTNPISTEKTKVYSLDYWRMKGLEYGQTYSLFVRHNTKNYGSSPYTKRLITTKAVQPTVYQLRQTINNSITSTLGNPRYAKNKVINKDNTIMAVALHRYKSGVDSNEGIIIFYKKDKITNAWTEIRDYRSYVTNTRPLRLLPPVLEGVTISRFGRSISISDDGKKLFVGALTTVDSVINSVIYVYKYGEANQYIKTHTILPPDQGNQKFGYKTHYSSGKLFISSDDTIFVYVLNPTTELYEELTRSDISDPNTARTYDICLDLTVARDNKTIFVILENSGQTHREIIRLSCDDDFNITRGTGSNFFRLVYANSSVQLESTSISRDGRELLTSLYTSTSRNRVYSKYTAGPDANGNLGLHTLDSNAKVINNTNVNNRSYLYIPYNKTGESVEFIVGEDNNITSQATGVIKTYSVD